MSYAAYDTRSRDDIVAIPRIWLTFLLSLLLHGLALWLVLPQLPNLRQGSNALTDTPGQLAVQLVPKSNAPAAASVPPSPATPPPGGREAPPPPLATLVPRKSVPTPRPATPPILTAPPAPQPRSAPVMPLPTPPAPPAVTAPAPPPLDGDLASYIASRRRARGETGESTATGDPAAESETARRDRLVAMNLGAATRSATTLGNEPKNGGGTFQIRTLEFDYAEFTFFGWNKEINRRAFQVMEVRRGGSPDINTAVVRRIIAIIREHEQGDFRWESKRLGRDITLSARPADNSSLESFMLEEFFTSSHQPR